jgi:hypothetical protein
MNNEQTTYAVLAACMLLNEPCHAVLNLPHAVSGKPLLDSVLVSFKPCHVSSLPEDSLDMKHRPPPRENCKANVPMYEYMSPAGMLPATLN